MAIAVDSTAKQDPNPGPHGPWEESCKVPGHPDHGEGNSDEEEDEDDDVEELDGPAGQKEKAQAVFRRLSTAPVSIRVHDITIKGNSKTRDALIEAEVADLLRSAATVQGLVNASSLAIARLRRLEVFDSVSIILDAGPPELPGTTKVIIEVVHQAAPSLETSAASPSRR